MMAKVEQSHIILKSLNIFFYCNNVLLRLCYRKWEKRKKCFLNFHNRSPFVLTVCDICSQFSEICSPFVLTLCTKKYILNILNIFLHLYWLCAQTRQKVKAFPKFQWRPLSLLKKQQLADMELENSVCTFWIYGPKKKSEFARPDCQSSLLSLLSRDKMPHISWNIWPTFQ